MRLFRTNRLAFLSELGRTPLGLMLGIGLTVAIATAVVVLALPAGGGHGPAGVAAHVTPEDCDTTIGAGGGTISAPGAAIADSAPRARRRRPGSRG